MTDTIVGEGFMSVPTSAGPSDLIEVLMVKEVTAYLDSFFLDGAPAPNSLLGAFGLTQGARDTITNYLFYREGSSFPLAMMGVSNDETTLNFIWVDNDPALLMANEPGQTPESAVELFPSVFSPGQSFSLVIHEPRYDSYRFAMVDLQGRAVIEQDIQTVTGRKNVFQFNPGAIQPGIYFYRVTAKSGAEFTGKILVSQ